jgi:hypothetical protein
MDESLNGYMNSQPGVPPVITERQIAAVLARRARRASTILLSLASLLWTVLLYGYAFVLGRENQAAGIALLCVLTLGYICAGCFAGIVMKYRKAGF